MARNYQIGEVVEIIAKGEDAEAIQDLGRRYPLLVAKVAKIVNGANQDAVVEMFNYMPDYLSANKVNKSIRQQLGLLGDKEDKDAEDDTPVEDEKPAKKEKKESAKKATKKSDDPYAGKDAIELFKECKKRGIKAAAKKTAKFYANLLKKADEEAAAAEAEADAEDDDWDEEEEEVEEKPAKKGKKSTKKAEPVEDDDDEDEDDDDWDI